MRMHGACWTSTVHAKVTKSLDLDNDSVFFLQELVFFFLHCCLAVTRSGTHPEIGLRKVLSEADQQLSRGRI